MSDSVSILMPVYNELATVERAIDDALTAELPVESRQLVLVDDGSKDGTRELLQARELPANVTLVLHDRNRGKGAALQTALQHATGDWAAVLDADLEYRASDLGPLLEPLLSGEANVVFGTRSWSSHSAYSFWYVMGNKGVTFATNVIYNCWISDVMTCHKAMSTELFRSLRLRERGFSIEPEIAARVLRSGERIYEVPISYAARSREEGKKLTALDGVAGATHAPPLPGRLSSRPVRLEEASGGRRRGVMTPLARSRARASGAARRRRGAARARRGARPSRAEATSSAGHAVLDRVDADRRLAVATTGRPWAIASRATMP